MVGVGCLALLGTAGCGAGQDHIVGAVAAGRVSRAETRGDGQRGELDPAGPARLGQQMLDVGLDGARRDVEPGRDVAGLAAGA